MAVPDARVERARKLITLTEHAGEIARLHMEVAALEAELGRVQAHLASKSESLDAALASRAAMEKERDELRAALVKIADHGKGFTDEQMHLRIYAATYYRWAKSEADAVVAKHRKGESDVL